MLSKQKTFTLTTVSTFIFYRCISTLQAIARLNLQETQSLYQLHSLCHASHMSHRKSCQCFYKGWKY